MHVPATWYVERISVILQLLDTVEDCVDHDQLLSQEEAAGLRHASCPFLRCVWIERERESESLRVCILFKLRERQTERQSLCVCAKRCSDSRGTRFG